uniref:Ig-like domain-containing protein n=1 Tax=Neogobius melanostomus TaxID=47308 RepID=A0A8C6S5D4_9GOBI
MNSRHCASLTIQLCQSSSSNVRQTPSEIFVEMGQQSKIHCSHKIQDYNRILWYKQLKGSRQLQFLGYMNVNDGYPEKGRFQATKPDAVSGTLTVGKLEPGDSGVYFCAVSVHSETN